MRTLVVLALAVMPAVALATLAVAAAGWSLRDARRDRRAAGRYRP